MTRTCGTCSLCCKLPYVAELSKPIDTWCRHCKPGKGGCSIYSERPQQCMDFICAWLNGDLDDEWFPARAKMYARWMSSSRSRTGRRFMIDADPAFPNMWRREPYHSLIRRIAAGGHGVGIRIGRRIIELDAGGGETQKMYSQAFIEGRAADER
jgi:hypothetical protein